jgi:hypothetical protein
MKIVRIFLLVLLIALVAIQFFRPSKNESKDSFQGKTSNSIFVSDSVHKILVKACYDCHSNSTRYPWYAEIQPVGWWLNDHITEGKRELNFDEFASYHVRRRYHKLGEVAKMVESEEMPLWSYTLVHKDAVLTTREKELMISWSKALQDSMKAKYPLDSLIRKRN